MKDSILSKSAQARALGVARSTVYYQKTQGEKDWLLKQRIEEVLRTFPSYGYRRLAIHLSLNKKQVQRVMRLFGIKAYRRRGRKLKKPKNKAIEYPNLLMGVIPLFPHHVWVADFTHLSWKKRDVCVATVMDVFTRDIVGVAVATRHTTTLVTQALSAALLNHPHPRIFHSDNGVEYNAKTFREILTSLGIEISRSKKGCPWENGYQESFYDKFKVDLGDPNRYQMLGELVYAIYQTIHTYNTIRIHSVLRMSPRQFAALHRGATLSLSD